MRGRATYEQFSEVVWAAGLIPHACTSDHWQIIGGDFLVNFYPYAQHGSTFCVAGSKGRPGLIEQAIAAAHRPPEVMTIQKAEYKPKYHRRIKAVLLRKDPRCFYCRKHLDFKTATIDHRLPRDKGGTNSQDNLVLACSDCNRDKKNMMPQDFKAKRQFC